jgi:type I restriction enzyme S subunit
MNYKGPIGGLISFAIGGGWGVETQKEGFTKVAIIRGTDIPRVAAGDYSSVPYRYESDKKIVNRKLSVGDIVLETAGGSSANGQFTGRTLLITEEVLEKLGTAICASFCKRLELNKNLVAPEYFYYYMQDLYKSGRVAAYDSQSTGISNFQFEVFLNNEYLEIGSIKEQEAAARSLMLLQRKLNLKVQLSKTLEDIAQTIFKSWFIDFDPVKAKMAGEKPIGMDAATAALFPDSMEDSELGFIPKGWKVEEFGSVSNLLMGQSPPGETYNEHGTGLPFYQGKTDFGARFPKRRVYCSAGKRVASVGEVLISVRAPVGDLNQAIEECVIGRGVASALHKSGSQSYSFSLLTSLQPKLAYYNSEGTVFGAINKFDFQSMKVVEPSKGVLTAFDQLTNPINEQIRSLFLQTELLIALRDSLLPRLISGELQIPEEMLAS